MLSGNTEATIAWKSKWLSDEGIKLPTTPGNNLCPKLKWIHYSRMSVEFKESYLKQDKETSTHRNKANLFVV